MIYNILLPVYQEMRVVKVVVTDKLVLIYQEELLHIGVSTEINTGVQLTSTMIGDSILSDMCSGTWSVLLTDANGCTSSLFPGGVGVQTVGYEAIKQYHKLINLMLSMSCVMEQVLEV